MIAKAAGYKFKIIEKVLIGNKTGLRAKLF